MNSLKNYLLLLLVLFLAGASWFGWKRQQELAELHAAAASARAEQVSLQKMVSTSQERAKELESEVAALRSRITAAESAKSTPAEPAAATPRSFADMAMDAVGMMDNPEMQRLQAIQQKAGLSARYASLFKALRLDPVRLGQFKDLLVEKQMVNMDVMAAAAKQGINPLQNPLKFQQLTRDTQAEIDGKIKTVLGEAGYAQFENYQQTQGQRTLATQLELNLSYTDTPLTAAQSEQLVQTLRETAPVGLADLLAGRTGRSSSPITDDAIARAQSFLTPPQVQALQEIQQQQQATAQATRVMMQNRMSQPKPAVPTKPATTPGG